MSGVGQYSVDAGPLFLFIMGDSGGLLQEVF